MHGVREKGLQSPSLKCGLLFQSFEHLTEHFLLLTLGQDLEAEVVVPHILLIDDQHRQQHIEQVSYPRSSADAVLSHSVSISVPVTRRRQARFQGKR